MGDDLGELLLAAALEHGVRVYLRGEHLVLYERHRAQWLARSILEHETEVVAALRRNPAQGLQWSRPGDHDAPYRFGLVPSESRPAPFSPAELARLRRLKARWLVPQADDRPSPPHSR